MQQFRLTLVATAMVATFAFMLPLDVPSGFTRAALAQQGNQQWFVPGQGGAPSAGQPRAPSRPPAQRPAAGAPDQRPVTPSPQSEADDPANEPPSIQVQLPPMPDVPAISRGPSPPAAVIGTFGFRDVLRASTAVQQLEKALGERRDRLNQDVQKEQNAWRDQQQQLAKQRATMNPEQIRAKERELQERVTNAQRQFRERTRMLQESYQYGAAQVERVTGQILRQVAESRGMNMVLPREQVPLSAADFDITDTVVEHLNKIMTSVIIPPENVPLAKFAPTVAAPQSNAPAAATPAAAAPAAPAKR